MSDNEGSTVIRWARWCGDCERTILHPGDHADRCETMEHPNDLPLARVNIDPNKGE